MPVRKVCSSTRKRCPNLTTQRLCPTCQREAEQARGSSTERGYDAAWRSFRAWFRALLASEGIIPACGSALPTGPDTRRYSRCLKQGITNVDELHLDHEPPLTPAERKDPSAIRNPNRVGFLCRSCHSAKTVNEHAFQAI